MTAVTEDGLGTLSGDRAAAAPRSVSRFWTRLRVALGDPVNALIATVVVTLIAGGIGLRIQGVGEPPYFTFDEKLFVANAHNYLLGLPDANDHPPLGKLLMALGVLLFGYNSVGWRFVPLCFGLQTLLVAYWLGSSLFNRRAGWLAAAFLAADGFFISYSRAGLLDGMLSCLVLWSVVAAVTARSWAGTAITAVLIGLTTSVKWSGAFALIPATAAVLLLGRAPRLSVLAFVLAPVTHAALWIGGLAMTEQPHALADLWAVINRLFVHHLAMGTRDNGLASPWYSWLYLGHPIVTKLSWHGAACRYSSSVGNVIFWFSSLALIALLAFLTPLMAGFRRVRTRVQRVVATEHLRAAFVLAVGWAALISPWTVARGKYTFSYHYLPSYGFALVLLAGAVSIAWRRTPRLTCGFLCAAAAVSVFFAPVWGELPISEASANLRLILPGWRP